MQGVQTVEGTLPFLPNRLSLNFHLPSPCSVHELLCQVRCDRSLPCGTCVKRGCASLCPNGVVPPGQGSRFVLAATDHLRRKLAKLEARMHLLEDALAVSDESDSHPLLMQSLHPLVETTDEPTLKATIEEPPKYDPATLTDALGTLYINKDGSSRFFGPSGGAEVGPPTLLLCFSRTLSLVPPRSESVTCESNLQASSNVLS
jgi:hypothetical protein